MGEIEQKEIINLLSQEKIVLNPKDIVVRNEKKIISLAGIIETEKISWAESTKNVLVEGDFFEPDLIKKTAKRLNVSFPRNKVKQSTLFFSPFEVLQKFVSFLSEIQKTDLETEIIFTSREKPKQNFPIKVSQSFLEKKMGQKFTNHQIEKIWKQLSFSYSKKGKVYQVEIPFYRSDLKIPEDLLEEFLRIYDYNRIVSSLL